MNSTAQYPAALSAIETLEQDATAMRFETWWQTEGAQMRNDPIVSVAYAAFTNGAVNSETPIVITKEIPAVGLFAFTAIGAIIGAIAATIAFHLVA